jgi:hypothetical protein
MCRYSRVAASRGGISFRLRRNEFVYQICLLVGQPQSISDVSTIGASIGLVAASLLLRQARFTASVIGRRPAREGAIIRGVCW